MMLMIMMIMRIINYMYIDTYNIIWSDGIPNTTTSRKAPVSTEDMGFGHRIAYINYISTKEALDPSRYNKIQVILNKRKQKTG